jgi:uncharacterized protein (UPF0335 family)
MSEAARIIKSYVDRIEALEEQQRDLGSDKRDVYAEAKGRGYNPKALRKLVAERKRKVDEETEHDLEVYRLALEQAVEAASTGSMSQRAAAKKFGVSKSAVNRGVPRAKISEQGTPEHDPSTGEVIESPTAGVEPLAPGAAEQAPSIKANEAGSSAANPTDESCGDGHAPVSAETQPRAPGSNGRAAPAVATGEGAGIQSGPHETDPWDDVLAHKRRLDEMKRAKGFAA